jgi:hypothetical protein
MQQEPRRLNDITHARPMNEKPLRIAHQKKEVQRFKQEDY